MTLHVRRTVDNRHRGEVGALFGGKRRKAVATTTAGRAPCPTCPDEPNGAAQGRRRRFDNNVSPSRGAAQSSVGASQMTHRRAFERQASAGIGTAGAIDRRRNGKVSSLGAAAVPCHPMVATGRDSNGPTPSGGSIVSLAASVDVPGHDGAWRAAGGRPARQAPSRTRGNLAHCDCLRYPPGPEPLGWSSGPPPRLGAGSVSWPVMSRRASSGGVVEPAFAPSTLHRGEVPVCPAGRAATDCPGRPGRRSLAEHVRACAAISKRPSTSSSSVVSSRFGRPQTCGNPIGGRRDAGIPEIRGYRHAQIWGFRCGRTKANNCERRPIPIPPRDGVPAPGGPNPPWSARRPFTVVWPATGLPGHPVEP